jgi:predicted nucleic acid-binding protein
MIFVDTSAFLALMAAEDVYHLQAKKCFQSICEQSQSLQTNNYVLIESLALIQKKLGLLKVREFLTNILPLVEVKWMGEEAHQAAVDHLLSARRRGLSLVDCSAFETMDSLGIDTAFTFDEHFRDEGFKVIP